MKKVPYIPKLQSVLLLSSTKQSKGATFWFCFYIFYTRLKKYDLDDDNDDVANYLILSLQTEQIIPQFSAKNNFSVKTGDDYVAMEERINEAIKIHNVSYLEFLRDIAVNCDQFIFFVREKSFGPD